MNLTAINQTMNSRDIADLTGKSHAHLMRDIRNMEPAWEKVTESKFGLSEYTDPSGRKLPMYELSKKECLYVATKFNDEARAKLIIRWEELESRKIDSISRKELAMMLVEAEEEKERLQVTSQLQARELKESAPKVEYYEEVLQSGSLILTNVIAKELGMSAVSLNRLLYKLGIIYKTGDTWVLYHKYQDKRFASTKTYVYYDKQGNQQTTVQLCWYESGREFVHKKVKEFLNLNKHQKKISSLFN